ncbi:1,4-dihydroxy-6-naphthoate synthase [Brevibacillus porteri]|uniref:1,4-dihydroxy-6-naphthoate synthase n=1 Tax=Brevibacillus porteri TaxID=2126350 RepID=UPI00370C006F
MENLENLYCKLFIDTDIDRESLVQLISKISSGVITKYMISTRASEIEVRKNSGFDSENRLDKIDGFLYFRYYCDIEPKNENDKMDYVTSIGVLLRGLWDLNIRAVAACDFEELLPNSGGYKY